MAVDIAPELYKKINASFQERYKKAQLFGNPISDTLAKLKDGSATFRDADLYAGEVGSMLSEALKEHIKLEDMPNGRFYYNIAEKTVGRTLQEEYGLASNVAGMIQEQMNEAQGIGLKVIKPEPSQYKVQEILNRASKAETQQELDAALSKPVETFVRKAPDDTMKKNADLHDRAGLEVTVEREYDGVGLHQGTDACEWCIQRAGKWTYDQAKANGVFERHEGCGCILDYISKKGRQRQTDWKHNSWQDQADKDERIRRNEIISANPKNRTTYTGGIPKTWKVFKPSEEDALINANPNFNPFIVNGYRKNCSNCAAAYEMRRRGFDVVAKPSTSNHYLRYHPEAAWEGINESNIIKTTGTGLQGVIEEMNKAPMNARYEVAFNISPEKGHIVIAENRENGIIFLDPQYGKEVTEDVFTNVMENKTRLWRIDNAVISDRGITAVQPK